MSCGVISLAITSVPPEHQDEKISWKLTQKPKVLNCTVRVRPASGDRSSCQARRLAKARWGTTIPFGLAGRPRGVDGVHRVIGERRPPAGPRRSRSGKGSTPRLDGEGDRLVIGEVAQRASAR